MGRPREFEMEEALDAAMAVFHERGYQGASMVDLVAATGLQKGSLYKAFEDKHDLFTKCLGRYLEQGRGEIECVLNSTASPKAGLRKWLDGVIVERNCSGNRVGCFAVNSVVELGVNDENVSRQLAGHFAHLRSILVRVIRKGQELGELRDDRSAEVLSDFVVTMSSGLAALSKGQISRTHGKQVVDFALASVSL